MDTNGRAYVWYRKDSSEPWTLSVSGWDGRLIGTVYEQPGPLSMCKRFVTRCDNNGQAPGIIQWFDTLEEGRAWLEEQDALVRVV
jgi:hypothetical protein